MPETAAGRRCGVSLFGPDEYEYEFGGEPANDSPPDVCPCCGRALG